MLARILIGLTGEEYRDFASALVSYVALPCDGRADDLLLNLCRDYTRKIAAVSAASKTSRRLVPVLARRRRLVRLPAVRGVFAKSLRIENAGPASSWTTRSTTS
jgi:hypothetical protein